MRSSGCVKWEVCGGLRMEACCLDIWNSNKKGGKFLENLRETSKKHLEGAGAPLSGLRRRRTLRCMHVLGEWRPAHKGCTCKQRPRRAYFGRCFRTVQDSGQFTNVRIHHFYTYNPLIYPLEHSFWRNPPSPTTVNSNGQTLIWWKVVWTHVWRQLYLELPISTPHGLKYSLRGSWSLHIQRGTHNKTAQPIIISETPEKEEKKGHN